MAGSSAATMAANQAALKQAADNARAVMAAGAAGAAVAAPAIGEAAVEAIRSLIDIQGPPRSEPGEPPHMDTGDLWESYAAEVEEDGGEVVLTVGSDMEYAPYLEFGTSRMEARPHVRPALEGLVSDGTITRIVRYEVAAAQSAAIASMGGRTE